MVNSNIVASSSGGRPDGIDEMLYLMTVDVVVGRDFVQIILDFITTSSVTTCLLHWLFFCYYSAMQSIFVHSSSIGSRWMCVMGVRWVNACDLELAQLFSLGERGRKRRSEGSFGRGEVQTFPLEKTPRNSVKSIFVKSSEDLPSSCLAPHWWHCNQWWP